MLYITSEIVIYFGDEKLSISPTQIAQQTITPNLISIGKLLGVTQMVFPLQNHGIDGRQILISDTNSSFFVDTSDYLWTKKKLCGIGIVTADCLPIVMYDPITSTSAIVHAGWKGLLAGIFQKTIAQLSGTTGCMPKNLNIYLGPAAKSCCYEVQQDFVDLFYTEYTMQIASSFIKKNGAIYFDSTVFIMIIARNLGIKHENIYTIYNVCTLCNLSFCSYRRQKDQAYRQVTMISLY